MQTLQFADDGLGRVFIAHCERHIVRLIELRLPWQGCLVRTAFDSEGVRDFLRLEEGKSSYDSWRVVLGGMYCMADSVNMLAEVKSSGLVSSQFIVMYKTLDELQTWQSSPVQSDRYIQMPFDPKKILI
jgi:hypothetical protein